VPSQQGDGKAWLLRIPTRAGADFSLDVAALALEESCSFVDADFYDSEQLAVLCAEGNNSMRMGLISYDEQEMEFSALAPNTNLKSLSLCGDALEMSYINHISSGSKPFTHIHTGRQPFGSIFREVSRIIIYDAEYEEDEEDESDDE